MKLAVELVVTDLGNGLARIDCPDCGQTCRAVSDPRAIDAKAAEHRCGGEHWHLGQQGDNR